MERHRILPDLPKGADVKALALSDVDGTLIDDRAPEQGGIGETSTVLYNKLVREGFVTNDQLLAARPVYKNVVTLEELDDLREQYDHAEGAERRNYLNPLVANLDATISATPRTSLHAIARELVREEIIPNLYAEPVDILKDARENGSLVALVSGAPNFVVRALGRALGADYAIGTYYFPSGKGYSQARPSQPRSRQKERHVAGLQRAITAQYLASPNDALPVSVALGDTEHDEGLFRYAEQRYVIGEKPCVQKKLGELGLSFNHIVPARHASL